MRHLRLRAKKRAEEIAAETGVAMSTVRSWEQGKTAPRTSPLGMLKLMQVYQCSFDELVEAEREVIKKSESEVA